MRGTFSPTRLVAQPVDEALHSAIASDHGATVVTLNQRLAEVGPRVGAPTRGVG